MLSFIPARNVYWNGTLSSGNLLFSLAAVGVTLAVAGKIKGNFSGNCFKVLFSVPVFYSLYLSRTTGQSALALTRRYLKRVMEGKDEDYNYDYKDSFR